MSGETLLSTAFQTVAHLKVAELEQLMPLPCGPGECASFVSEGKLLDNDYPLERLPRGDRVEILRLLQEGLTFHFVTDNRIRVSREAGLQAERLKGTLKMPKALAGSLTVEKLKQQACDMLMNYKPESEALSQYFDLHFGDEHLPNDAVVEDVLPLSSSELELRLGSKQARVRPAGMVQVLMVQQMAAHAQHAAVHAQHMALAQHALSQHMAARQAWAMPPWQPAAPAWAMPPEQPAAPAWDMPPAQLVAAADMTQTELRDTLQQRLQRSLRHRG